MESKLTVLLTNDDGFHAPGIKYLQNVLKKEFNVIVAAPEFDQSGVGHLFTYTKPLHYEKCSNENGVEGYVICGSPADCIKFAVSYLLPQKPDLIISGINYGDNSGINAFYSGTVGGAREGAFWNIPSFSFSVCEGSIKYCEEYASLIPQIVRKILSSNKKINSVKETVFYNVNFPPCKLEEVNGIRVTRQSMAFFDDRYEKIVVESHRTGEGYMVVGDKKDIEKTDEFDSSALKNNFITVTPLTIDATAQSAISQLRWLEDEDFLKR